MPRLEPFKALAQLDLDEAWIVEGLISPGAWTYFVGPPGVGKSMMCIQLCAALQAGEPFLGLPTTTQNCLYLQADAGLYEWQKQVKNLAPESAAWSYCQVDQGCLDDPASVLYLEQLVQGTYAPISPYSKVLKHKPFSFVVFDCLNAITKRDLNTKAAMNAVLEALTTIMHETHYLLIHHPSSTVQRGVHAGSGYKGFAGLCGTMLTLTGTVLALEKSKVASKREMLLERHPLTGAWSLPQWE